MVKWRSAWGWKGPDLVCGVIFSVVVESWMGHEWVKWEEAEGIRIYAGMHVDKNK